MLTMSNAVVSAAFALRQSSSTTVQTTSVTSWTPSTIALAGVLAGSLLVYGQGCWNGADGFGNAQAIPANSNGTFLRSGNACASIYWASGTT